MDTDVSEETTDSIFRVKDEIREAGYSPKLLFTYLGISTYY
jgi:hypothetical protein